MAPISARRPMNCTRSVFRAAGSNHVLGKSAIGDAVQPDQGQLERPQAHRLAKPSPPAKPLSRVKDLSEGSPIRVTSRGTDAARPMWSSRGDQIVFERRGQGIWSVPSLGGPAHLIIEDGREATLSTAGGQPRRITFDQVEARSRRCRASRERLKTLQAA